jgi:acyl-CoA thioester hydrolase
MAEYTMTYRGVVYPWQCDHMGHMNVMWYAGKFDEASWQILSMVGLSSSHLRSEGAGLAAVEQHIEYKRELRSGTAITIRSAVLEVTEKSIRLVHKMNNDETGDVAATTVVVGVYFDTAARKARPLPSEMRKRAEQMIANGMGFAPQYATSREVETNEAIPV